MFDHVTTLQFLPRDSPGQGVCRKYTSVIHVCIFSLINTLAHRYICTCNVEYTGPCTQLTRTELIPWESSNQLGLVDNVNCYNRFCVTTVMEKVLYL